MKDTISKSGYRKLKLLNYLLFSEDRVQKKYLAGRLGISVPTLETYVQEINQDLEDFVSISNEDKRYCLTRRQDINFDTLTAFMIKHSFSFDIIIATLHGQEKTVNSWLEERFMSRTGFYGRLKELDNLLARSNLILEKNPIYIAGNELNIRFFYVHVLAKAYPITGWIIQDFAYEDFEPFIQKLEDKLGIYFSPSTRVEYAISLGVMLTRFQQGKFVQLDTYQRKYLEEAVRYFQLPQFDFSDLEKLVDTPIPDLELYLLFLSHFLVPFTYYDRKKIAERLSQEVVYLKPLRDLVETLVNFFFHDKPYNTEMLKVYLLNFLVRFVFVGKITDLLDINYFSKKISPVTFSKARVDEKVNRLLKTTDFGVLKNNRATISQYAFDLFNVFMLDKQKEAQLTIKIVAKNGSIWEEYLKTILRKRYPANVITFSNDLESKEHLPQYDLIISDFPIENNYACPLLTWNFPPTKKELEGLESFLSQV
ncbi:helix-turn-helix domain-containing protein [Listeria booriae]|uniref:helix-turn-helix domain-containing protein n=1 Tax=Listeria booriae TaxID=1552123 RepID=UPI002880A4FB|nr:helix-turn-helix domain-containing protein [Listeria booriae]MDT0111358.1 helix-turn-helix domain-containing protein [Listeria booriae]